jgi:DNA-binding NarL/FixJ family response regulator
MTEWVSVRILIADDHELVRKGVWSILAPCEHLEVCGEAANGQEAVQKAIELRPDLIILDVAMPIQGGFSAAKEIKKSFPDVPILILSMHDDPEMIRASKLAGAQGFITKTDVSAALLIAVEALLQGQTFYSDESSWKQSQATTT